MKIDLKELQAIFGDKLPTKASFLANNDGHNISMRAIRKHVGAPNKIVFSKVWALFVAEYDEFIGKQRVVKQAPKKEVEKKVVKPVVKEESDDNKDS